MITSLLLSIFSPKLFIRSQTDVTWTDDLSVVNLSLFKPNEIINKRLQIAQKVRYTVDELNLNGISSTSSGGSFRIINPSLEYFVKNNFFHDNSSPNGGAFFFNSFFPLFLSNCSFKNNNSTNQGGSIYLTNTLSNTYTISNCIFEDTNANTFGGAIFLSSSFQVFFNFWECTLYKCKSNNHGGGFYLYSIDLRTNISKICISFCFFQTVNSGFFGTSCYIQSGSTGLIRIEFLSCYSCGVLGSSTGTIYINNAEHSIHGLNYSLNRAHTSCIGYFYSTISSIYQYNNFINCSSSANYGIHFSYGGFQIDFDYSNIIRNDCKQYGIFYSSGSVIFKFFVKYCIFLNNIVSSHLFFFSPVARQTIRSCYIVLSGSGTLQNTQTNENCIITSVLTQTYLLTHYSTYLCQTPYELGILDINSGSCQTQPPIPTSCFIESNNEQINFTFFSKLFYIIFFHFLLIK